MSARAQALEAALRELTAMVRGECPSLLNEDSGGCARLSIEIDALLAAPPVGVSPQPDDEPAPTFAAIEKALAILQRCVKAGVLPQCVLRSAEGGVFLAFGRSSNIEVFNEGGEVYAAAPAGDAVKVWRLRNDADIDAALPYMSPASLSPVEPTPEPPPDAQVCVWREREWDYESGCRGTQISRDERSSGPPDGWKHCPYCGKRLEVGTAPQGGEQ